MISIIICSVKPELLSNISANIASTIGCDYQLLSFDNRIENLGICRVYNNCANLAEHPYLCFVHEDVLFNSENWGRELISTIESQPQSGVVGVAGSKYVPRNFISWGDCVVNDRWNLSQFSAQRNQFEKTQYNPDKETASQVTILDGVLLFTRRSTWKNNPFDHSTYSGFHLYDADFSLGVSRIANNYVCQTIHISHLSSGQGTSKEYYESLLLFHRKWKSTLPLFTNDALPYYNQFRSAHEEDNMFFLLRRSSTHFGWAKAIFQSIKLNGLKPFLSAAIKRVVKIQTKSQTDLTTSYRSKPPC